MIREKSLDKIRSLKLVVHFDTKILKQYTTEEKKISSEAERLAISASSPESDPLDLLLGILEIPTSTASDQILAIQDILDYDQMSDQIIGFCVDTTYSNTGKKRMGPMRNIVVRALQRPVLWLTCRHNIYERNIPHAMKVLLDPTKGPSTNSTSS